jgi:hypothetical protein
MSEFPSSGSGAIKNPAVVDAIQRAKQVLQVLCFLAILFKSIGRHFAQILALLVFEGSAIFYFGNC